MKKRERSLCWKCGLEGLSIHTNRGAQPYKKEKKEDVGQHIPRDPVSLWAVVSENGNGKCTEDKHTRQGKRYTAGDDSASPAPDAHAGDSYRIQIQVTRAHLPLQPIDNCIPGPPSTPPSTFHEKVEEAAEMEEEEQQKEIVQCQNDSNSTSGGTCFEDDERNMSECAGCSGRRIHPQHTGF
ncbi:unnamed protein product [Caretta caretta]